MVLVMYEEILKNLYINKIYVKTASVLSGCHTCFYFCTEKETALIMLYLKCALVPSVTLLLEERDTPGLRGVQSLARERWV